MLKITKTNVNNRIIFKYKDIQFRIGDEIFFYPPSKDDDPGFYNSNLGELVKSGKIDSLKLIVIETDCLEIIFRFNPLLNGKELTNLEYLDLNDKEDPWLYEPYSENGNYVFMKYLTNKS